MSPKKIDRFLEAALDIARESTNCSPAGYAMGCVIVRHGKIIASGSSEPYNAVAERISLEHSEIFDNSYFSLHAEVKAVTSTKRVKKTWVFVNGMNIKSGNILSCSKPCPNCQAILEYLNVRAVCYVEDGKPVVMYL